jgi:hypothetical protein
MIGHPQAFVDEPCASPAALAPVMAFARRRSRASNEGVKRMDSGVLMTTLSLLRYIGSQLWTGSQPIRN